MKTEWIDLRQPVVDVLRLFSPGYRDIQITQANNLAADGLCVDLKFFYNPREVNNLCDAGRCRLVTFKVAYGLKIFGTIPASYQQILVTGT